MGPIQTLDEVIAFLRRRIDIIAAIFGLGMLASLVAAMMSEPLYQSHAAISARINTVSGEFAAGAPQTAPARLLQLVEARLTTRDTMLALADRHEMFMDLSPQERVELMRESINFFSQEAVAIGFGRDGVVASIVVQARADTALKAAAIANELSEMIITETGAGREGSARETLAFLQTRAEQISTELDTAIAEGRSFDAEHPEALPFNVELRRSELTQLTASIQTLESEITSLESELGALQRQGTTQRRLAQQNDLLLARQTELAQIQSRRADLEPFFTRLASIERQRGEITERERTLRDSLREITAQISTAEDMLRLETSQQIAAYEIVETALVPDYPISRSRRMTALMGTAAAGILAVMAAFGFELLRPALRSPAQFERETGMRPVMVLPRLACPSEHRRRLIARLAGIGLFGLGLLAVVITWVGS